MISVNNKNRQNRKGRIGRRLLAVLICLLTIMPMVSSALPEFTDMVGDIADKLGSLKRPDADSYSEGAKYLDDFLKEHPDATVFGRGDDIYGKDQARPTSVGTPGDRIDPDWFRAVVNVMGELKTQGEFALTPTDRTDGNPNGLTPLWNALADKKLYINYPDEGDGKRYTSTATNKTTWPISGFMNWVQYGDYQYVDGGNYPELSTTYGERDVDYGITSAYLGTSRVYNVGVIAVRNDKYLWVSVAEDGADDSVIVLPNPTPKQNITLHFGPREYPVSYDIVVDDLYLGKNEAETGAGKVKKNLSEMTLAEIQKVWGKDLVPDGTGLEDARKKVMLEVFGTLGQDSEIVTTNQTANFNVTIPAGTYGDVTYTTAQRPNDTVTVYPSSSGYGTQRLGTEPTYKVETDSEEGESSLETVGKPDRYSLSEPYTLGGDGSARGAVTVTVTITRRWGQSNNDTQPDYNVNGYKTHFEQSTQFSTFSNANGIDTANNRLYTKWMATEYKNPTPNKNGTFDATWMFTLNDPWSAGDGVDHAMYALEINGMEVTLPTQRNQVYYGEYDSSMWPVTSTLDDGTIVEIYCDYFHTAAMATAFASYFNSGDGHDKYPNLGSITERRYNGAFIIFIKNASRDINITNIQIGKNDDDSSRVGQIHVAQAAGVDVQLWYYNRYSARANRQSQRWWVTYPEGSWARIRYHHTNPVDQHGKFRFFASGSAGVTKNNGETNIYQEYNVRVALKNGYYWPNSDRDGNSVATEINGAATYEYNVNVSPYARTTDPITLYRYSESLKNGSTSNRYSNLGGTSEIIVDGSFTNSTFTFTTNGSDSSSNVLNGSYTASIGRHDGNGSQNLTTVTGQWTYDGKNLTLTNPASGEFEFSAQGGDPIVFTYFRDPDNPTRYPDRYWESEFVVTKDVFEALAEGAERWYYASLTMLPYLRSRESRDTYLRFEAVARTYELNYLTGVGSDGKGIGPNGEYEGRLPGIAVRSTTMPYDDNGYTDTTNYSKANGKDASGKYYATSFHIGKETPEADKQGGVNEVYRFQYWVLTDKDGNPIDEHGKVIVKGDNETVDEWQAKFITFYPSDSISLNTFDDLLMAEKDDPKEGEDPYTIEFDKKEQKFRFYLTACWIPVAAKPFTSYITINTRADVNGNGDGTSTETWFGGDWYEVSSGEKAQNQNYTNQEGIAEGLIKAAYTYTSFLDTDKAGKGDDTVTVTINKDKLIDYLGELAKEPGNEKYLWYTFDDGQNGWDENHKLVGDSYIWKKVKDKDEVPVWFLYSLGGVKLNTNIDGYDQPLPYKLTLTLPTYEDEDRTPVAFNADGSVKTWDNTNYRYTAGNESKFFNDAKSSTKYSVGVTLATATHAYTGNVQSYEGNAGVFGAGTDGSTTLELTRDTKDPQIYYATVYLGKDDSIAIPALPQGTTYGLELDVDIESHPDFQDNKTRFKYDGYAMQSAVESYYDYSSETDHGETSTIWKKTTGTNTDQENVWVLVAPGDHMASQDYFAVTDVTNNAFTSAEIERGGKKYKGINAYDTQVIKVTSKGTYTLYLDQYTIQSQDPDNEDASSWTNGTALQVQNFNYLSYITTARNLTKKDQTLQITFDVYTHRVVNNDTDFDERNLDKRYLAVSRVNEEDQDWNPEDDWDWELYPEGWRKIPAKYFYSYMNENGETETVYVDNGECIYVYENKNKELDYKDHSIIYTVPNVPSGATITLTVRTTVPAVNTYTQYQGNASLISKTDKEAGTFGAEQVKANVFSYWLRIAAFIGSEGYQLTAEDLSKKFNYTITLSNPDEFDGDGPIAVDNIIRCAIYYSSSHYGTENVDEYRDVTITADKFADGSFSFDVELEHDWRIVIYEIYDPDPDNGLTDEDLIGGYDEYLKGVKYTVTWDEKTKGYSVYLNAYDGGATIGLPGKVTYSNNIGEGIDMVVYRYMPSNDLTVSKTVEGSEADQKRVWKFVIELANKDLNALKGTYDIEYGGPLEWTEEQKAMTVWSKVDPDTGNVTVTVYLKHGQQITINELPQGTTYTITESAVENGLVFKPSYVKTDGDVTTDKNGVHDRVDEDGANTATGTIYVNQKQLNADGEWEFPKDDDNNDIVTPAKNIVAFTNSMSGDLVIEKVVSDYEQNKDKLSFKFQVTLTDANGAPRNGKYKDAAGNEVEFKDGGKATVTVAVDAEGKGSVKIVGLPNGTKYTVVEIGVENLYNSTWAEKGNSGTISGGENKVTCTNTKTGTLTIQKTVTGNSGSKKEEFTFTITLNGVGTETFAATHTGDESFDEITFTDGVAEVKLAHDQSITIVGLPKGATCTIVETVDDSYTTTYTLNDSEVEHEGANAEVAIAPWTSDGTTVKFTNNRQGNTPGGIMLTFAWVIPLLLLAVGGMAAIVIKRRKRVAL